MWFFFGFITIIIFSIYFAYTRIKAAWKGVPGKKDGIAYQYKVLRNKYGITGLLVGIEGSPGYDYSFKKETDIDRFFKYIGLSIEYQTENEKFNNLVYIVSDNVDLHKQISANIIITDTVVDIFKTVLKYNCTVKEIRNNSGRLWVKLKTSGDFNKDNITIISSAIAPLLSKITAELEHSPLSSSKKRRDPFVLKAAIILAVSTGLGINGMIQLMRIHWTDLPFTVDSNQLLIDAIYWGAGIIFILLTTTIVFLGRSSRTHLVMIELLLIGAFGAISTAYVELRDLNIELDGSKGVEYQVKILDKKISSSRRSTNYYLYTEDWTGMKLRKKVNVSLDFFYAAPVGGYLVVKQRSGFLKYRWVEALETKM